MRSVRHVALAATAAAAVLGPVSGASAGPLPVAAPVSLPAVLSTTSPSHLLRAVDWDNRTYVVRRGSSTRIHLREGRAALDAVTSARLGPVLYGTVGRKTSAVVSYRIVDRTNVAGPSSDQSYVGIHVFQVRRGRVVDMGHGLLPIGSGNLKGAYRIRLRDWAMELQPFPGVDSYALLDLFHGRVFYAEGETN